MSTKTYTYHLITYGCQMNKNDSERLESILLHMGMVGTEQADEADVIVLNTCSVRESAENRVFGAVRNFAALKEKNPNLVVAVTGCMPGRDKNGKMKEKLNGADLFFPIKDMIHLPQWLSSLNPNLRPMEDFDADYLRLRPTYQNAFQAYVTIQTGCNHFCAYCVVPFARGLEANRPLRDILAEVKDLADHGCLEITLLGQIVNHYIAPHAGQFSPHNPYQKNHFAKLLWEINQIPGIERVHWTAPHPLYMDEELIDALALPKQVNYIHLPVQSGNSEVLRRMNRRHDREWYIRAVDSIRAKRPEIAIGTDIIVGFCGETEAQFEDTVSLYKRCDFDISYHARYSSRSGTLSDRIYKDDAPKEEKKRRWEVLQALMEETTYRKNQAYVGKTVSVLIDSFEAGWPARHASQQAVLAGVAGGCTGNSSEMKRVRVKGDESMVGRIVEVEVFKADTWMLWGRVMKTKKHENKKALADDRLGGL